MDVTSCALPTGAAVSAKQDTIIGHLDGVEALITATNSKIDTFDAVLDAALVKQTAMATDLAALEVLVTSTNSLVATLDGVVDSILVKQAPAKTAQVLFDAVSIVAAENSTSSAIDVSSAKHVGFFGFDTGSGEAGVSISAANTSGGTYSAVATGTFTQGAASVGSLLNCPFKFLKVKISNSSGSTSDYTLTAAISS